VSGGRRDAARANQARILAHLRLAARKGDRTALALALDEMRTLAFSPRYWLKYLTLLRHPLARMVDLLVIKQGDRIAQQKGWPRASTKRSKRSARPPEPSQKRTAARASPRRRSAPSEQPTLFPGL
jgi:hypothetical protein